MNPSEGGPDCQLSAHQLLEQKTQAENNF